MACVAMGVFLSTVDASIVNIALPQLVQEFHTDFPTVQWVPLAYMLVITTLMLSVGRLADIVGKKQIYTLGLLIFTASSALCGFSQSIEALIGFRVVQAIGAAMNMALGAAILTEAFPPSERGTALGVVGTVVSLGVIVGPAVGGILIDILSWHWIFFVNIPVGIIGVAMAMRFLPSIKPDDTNQQFDYFGALAIFVFLITLLLGLTEGQRLGFTALPIVALFGVSLLALGGFIAIELGSKQPMVNLHLFKNSLISVSLIMGFIAFITISGTVLLISFYLQDILGYSTRTAGLLMSVVPVLLGISSPISGVLSDRFGTRKITLVGLGILVVGYVLLQYLDQHTGMLAYILLFIPIGIGMGVFQSPNNSAIMGEAPKTQLGVVSGLLSESRVLGQTLGVALVGAFWAGRVFDRLGETLPKGATTAPIAIQVAALQDTFFVMAIMMLLALLLGVGLLVKKQPG
jgi:EmrB/QacA subfamily drug resistance transporter